MVDDLLLVAAARRLANRALAIKLSAAPGVSDHEVIVIRKLALQARINCETVLASLEVKDEVA